MYNLKLNNYNLKPKSSNIQTPKEVSEFIFELLKDKIPKGSLILDPCCGQGNLLKPWKQRELKYDTCRTRNLLVPQEEGGFYDTLGIDVDQNTSADKHLDFLNGDTSQICKLFIHCNYEDPKLSLYSQEPSLVLCNPPFNGMKPKLAPEIWLDKIIELFGKEIPIVLFAPIRLRLCSTQQGERYQKWTKGTYPPISSIISLPTTGIFEKVDFFTEILIFNIPGLEPHYFYKPNHE